MGLNVVLDLCHMISYVRRVINTLIRVSLYRHWSIIRGRCHYLSGWSIMNRVMIIVIRDHSLIKRVCHNCHHTHYRHWHQHNLYLTMTRIQTAPTFISTWTHKNSFNHNNNNKQSKYSKKTHNYNKWKQNINNSLLSTLMAMCVFVMVNKCRMRLMLIWGDH